MDKNTIPEGFTVGMALTDALPVIFFCAFTIVIGIKFKSYLFTAGAVIALVSGLVKVLWKLIAAVAEKNVWPLFVQMRIFLPLGMVLMIAALIINRKRLDFGFIWNSIIGLPQVIFFALGIAGIILMCVFMFTLDGADPKSNWKEQTVNGLSQLFFLIGILLI